MLFALNLMYFGFCYKYTLFSILYIFVYGLTYQ
jgi:hypothetical protein